MNYSNPILCGHCENKAPMSIVQTHSQVRSYEDERIRITWEEGYVYEVLECPACSGITLRRYYWHDAMEPEARDEILYPQNENVLLGLPAVIDREYKAALKVKKLSPNAYSVLLGRLIELVCLDRKAKGNSVEKMLNNLAERGEIPDKVASMAESLHQIRHVGAHANVGEVTESEIPILDKLSRAILEYVYSAPHLVLEAETHLKLLRTAERKRKKRKAKK